MAVSGGLSTIWGFCHLGGRYFKNGRLIYCMELNSIQPSTKIYVKIQLRFWEFVSFWRHSSEFGVILDDLPIKINVFSHIDLHLV